MRRIIDRIREKVRSGQYGLTFHAIEEMAEEGFEEEDFEQAMVSGRVVRRQRDRLGRRKYTVEGWRAMRDLCEQCVDFQIPQNRWWLLPFTMQPKGHNGGRYGR